MPTFAGPVDRLPFAPPLERWTYARGRTVYRVGGTWVEGSDFPWDTLATADVVPVADRPGGEDWGDGSGSRYCFIGGKTYTVSAAVEATLEAAGYGAYVG